MNNFEKLTQNLEKKIQQSYQEGVSMEEAEKLAGEFLHAQMHISTMLRNADLDARMKKNGLKSIRGEAYADIVISAEKKPTETAIDGAITLEASVQGAQKVFDEAEVDRENLTRYYDIFRDAHIHFRTIAKGKFE